MPESIEILYSQSQDNVDQGCIAFPYTQAMRNDIGAWVKACRQAANLTQEQLGEALGKTKGNVSAWEGNRHEPSYDQMLTIAAMCNWEVPLPGIPTTTDTSWPFRSISAERYNAANTAAKAAIEDTVNKLLDAFEGSDHARPEDAAPKSHARRA